MPLVVSKIPFLQDLKVALELYCDGDTPSFDLCAIVSEVNPEGKVYNFTQGYIRLNQPTTPIRIPLQATCIQVQTGNAIRLSLSAACFPAS